MTRSPRNRYNSKKVIHRKVVGSGFSLIITTSSQPPPACNVILLGFAAGTLLQLSVLKHTSIC
jgi:hypothetical protein